MRRALITNLLLFALSSLEPAASSPGGVDLPDDEHFSIPVTVKFFDSEVTDVLNVLFQAALVEGEVDPCVSGRVSVEMQNVLLEEAFDALARSAELTMVYDHDEELLRIGCVEERATGDPTAYRDPDAPSVTLRFTLERQDREGRREVLHRPSLRVPPGQPAEISIGTKGAVPVFELNDEGKPFARTSRPAVGLEVFVARAAAPHPQELRGILELARSGGGALSAVRTATQPFTVDLPPDSTEIEVTRIRLGGETYILRVSCVAP